MSHLKIYSGPLSMFGAKVEIAAHEKGIKFELVMVRPLSAWMEKSGAESPTTTSFSWNESKMT